MKKNTVFMGVLVIIALLGGFFGGMKYQESKQPTGAAFFNGRQGQGSRMMGQFQAGNGEGRIMNIRQVIGEIISQDETSVTVKLQDGSTKIVLFSDKTTINKAQQGSKNDLKVGERVGVFGNTNADGSVTAQNIQLNPMMRGQTSSAPRQ